MVRCRGVIAFDQTQGHTTVGRTPLDEGSARCTDLRVNYRYKYASVAAINWGHDERLCEIPRRCVPGNCIAHWCACCCDPVLEWFQSYVLPVVELKYLAVEYCDSIFRHVWWCGRTLCVLIYRHACSCLANPTLPGTSFVLELVESIVKVLILNRV
jgi:hypothetical protein